MFVAPNGSRLSCGRSAGGRKVAEPPVEPAGEGTQFFAPSARQLQGHVRRRLITVGATPLRLQ